MRGILVPKNHIAFEKGRPQKFAPLTKPLLTALFLCPLPLPSTAAYSSIPVSSSLSLLLESPSLSAPLLRWDPKHGPEIHQHKQHPGAVVEEPRQKRRCKASSDRCVDPSCSIRALIGSRTAAAGAEGSRKGLDLALGSPGSGWV